MKISKGDSRLGELERKINFRRVVGNGKITYYLEDVWHMGMSIQDKLPRLYRISKHNHCAVEHLHSLCTEGKFRTQRPGKDLYPLEMIMKFLSLKIILSGVTLKMRKMLFFDCQGPVNSLQKSAEKTWWLIIKGMRQF